MRQAIAHAIDKDFVVKTIFLGYADAGDRHRCRRSDKQFYTPTCRPMPSTSAKANALLDEAGYPTRRRRQPLRAEAAAGALFQRDQAVRRLSAPGAGARSASMPRSSTTTRPPTRRRSTPTTPSTSPSRRPSSAAIRRSRRPSWSRAASPDGVPFSNQGGYANAALDALIAKAADDAGRRGAHRALQAVPEAWWRTTCR